MWAVLACAAECIAGEVEPGHWAYEPLKEPVPPMVRGEWARTPIDQFVLARLEAERMKPSPRAEPAVLLRRIYFDLIGLPPTPEEIRDFSQDGGAEQFERVVDRLLASPRYGERWARHWLDVVHYAETHGHDQDRIRTNAWPYRDYVLEAFNSDKPYARFIEEQVAGDVLYPDDPQAVVAMGFLATGPWDESSLRDIREDSIDRQIARYIDRDDIVATVMNTFVSTTVQCARCHNHKFDPVSQREYYNLQAVFAATDKANREYDPDAEVLRRRRALQKRLEDLRKPTAELVTELQSAGWQRKSTEWAKAMAAKAIAWLPMEPTSAVSSNGAELEILMDRSVLSKGKAPETDTYTISAAVEGEVTGLRIEVLTHESLPQMGPGRQGNGNLHLTNLRVVYSDGATERELALRNATADFNQQDWSIDKAIDTDPKTAWGIFPEVGKAHQAVFELSEPTNLQGTLRVVLEQNHGGGHLIGRVRVSRTSAAPPLGVSNLPDAMASIIGAERRTEEQALTLAKHVATIEAERELAGLPKPQLVYAGASDFVPDGSHKPATKPREVRVLRRGDIKWPGVAASPGSLSCVKGLPSSFPDAEDEGSRRAALARWISARENPLTWRSIVNRVWQYHFGRGLVSTPGDFGKMGGEPSHPELLDWLAAWFRENGGNFKKLHKLIVMSAVWQQSTSDVPEFSARDAENVLLWRMNRTRLDAECVRDAILTATGKLDLKMGGPSVQQFVLSAPIHVTPGVDYGKFDVDAPESLRRSIYRFIFRTLPDPFMDALDCPDSSQLTPTRNNSVTVLQALAMLNNRFVVRQSEHFARRLEQEAPGAIEEQIRLACGRALGREPGADEVRMMAEFAEGNGLANLCRVLFNSNEFMFVN